MTQNDLTWHRRCSTLLCLLWEHSSLFFAVKNVLHAFDVPWCLCSISELLPPSGGACKIIAHLQGYFVSVHFHRLSSHCNSVPSSMANACLVRRTYEIIIINVKCRQKPKEHENLFLMKYKLFLEA